MVRFWILNIGFVDFGVHFGTVGLYTIGNLGILVTLDYFDVFCFFGLWCSFGLVGPCTIGHLGLLGTSIVINYNSIEMLFNLIVIHYN